jgi:hypothetical protein
MRKNRYERRNHWISIRVGSVVFHHHAPPNNTLAAGPLAGPHVVTMSVLTSPHKEKKR